MKRILCGLACGMALFAGAESRTLSVWPGTDVRLEPGAASRVSAEGATAVVDVGDCPQNAWPGAYFTFPTARDLSQVGSVRVTFTNRTDEPLRLTVKIKGQTLQGRLPEGGLTVPPQAARTKDLVFFAEKWVFDKDPGLVGLKRRPYVGGGSSYSLEKVRQISTYLPAGTSRVSFGVTKIELVPGADARARQNVLKADIFFPWVDEFGQANYADWEDKVRSAEDLRVRVEKEDAALAARPCGIPGADQYGGWAAGPQLKSTGYFRTERIGGKWWFVDPEGHLFLSHGVNMGWNYTATAISQRERYFEKLPSKTGPTKTFWRRITWVAQRNFYSDPKNVPYDAFAFSTYNLFRKYGEDWRRADQRKVVQRQRAWGLNTTTGASGDLLDCPGRVPYVTAIRPTARPIQGADGYWGKLADPFAPEFAENCRTLAEKARTRGTNTWCLGWTANNEQSWGVSGMALARSVLASPDDQPAKIALLKILADRGKTVSTATTEDLRQLGEAVADTYYSTVRAAIKAVAPNHLYMGDRNDKLNPDVYRAASRHCDVITVNIYDHHPTRERPKGSEDKPFLVTEFHFGCYDTGYFYASLIPVKDQAARAQCYLDYLRTVVDSPDYIGAHWFQWRDCPITGVVGESANAQCGLVSMTDIPYTDLIAAIKTISGEMYSRRWGK